MCVCVQEFLLSICFGFSWMSEIQSKIQPPNLHLDRSGYSEPMKRKQKRTASAEVVARGQLAQEKLQALLDKVILAVSKAEEMGVRG